MRHALLVASMVFWGLIDTLADETPDGVDPQRAAEIIVEQTNELRSEQGQEPLARRAELEAAARYYAGYMADTDTYGHTADGNEPAERAAAHGYEFCIVAENVAYSRRPQGFDDLSLARDLMQGWIDSAGHRRNMLDSAVTEIGVAISHSARSGRYYAVQMFGRPEAQSLTFSIANESQSQLQYRLGGRDNTLGPGVTRVHRECRSPEITLRLPRGARPRNRTLEPRDGQTVVVAERPTGWQVTTR